MIEKLDKTNSPTALVKTASFKPHLYCIKGSNELVHYQGDKDTLLLIIILVANALD